MTDEYIDDHTYRPPNKSTGVKYFPARSKSSVRGFGIFEMPAEDHARQIIYESDLERKTLLMLCAQTDIWNVHDQPSRIPYTDFSGTKAIHIPDYLAQYKCGLRVAIAVKPYNRVQKTNFRRTLQAVKKHMSPSFADRLTLVTERNLHPAEVQNATLLQFCRQHRDQEADRLVAKAVAHLSEETSISDLVQEVGLNGRGFRAIFRAIYRGELIADRQKVISKSSRVSRPEQPPC